MWRRQLSSMTRWIFVFVGLAALVSIANAQSQFRVSEHYNKFEYQIAMRDGVKLFTSVYVPKDTSQKYPILMDRTPYSVRPYGADKFKSNLGPSRRFDEEGFIFVFQDVRGREHSEGEFVDVRKTKINPSSSNLREGPRLDLNLSAP